MPREPPPPPLTLWNSAPTSQLISVMGAYAWTFRRTCTIVEWQDYMWEPNSSSHISRFKTLTSEQCGEGYGCSGGKCINLQTDNSNCGTIGTVCKTGTGCSKGTCIDTTSDPLNCSDAGYAVRAPTCTYKKLEIDKVLVPQGYPKLCQLSLCGLSCFLDKVCHYRKRVQNYISLKSTPKLKTLNNTGHWTVKDLSEII